MITTQLNLNHIVMSPYRGRILCNSTFFWLLFAVQYFFSQCICLIADNSKDVDS